MADMAIGEMHRWWAGTAGPVLSGRSAAQQALAALHARPAGVGAAEWTAALRPALEELFRWAYPYDEAYATAFAAVGVFTAAHGYEPGEAQAYGESYATMNTDANVRVSAGANAAALATALGAAYADGDEAAFRRAYPEIVVRAVLLAAPQARDALVAGLPAPGVSS